MEDQGTQENLTDLSPSVSQYDWTADEDREPLVSNSPVAVLRACSKTKGTSRASSELSESKDASHVEVETDSSCDHNLTNEPALHDPEGSGISDSLQGAGSDRDQSPAALRRSSRLHPDRNHSSRDVDSSERTISTRHYMDHDEEDELLELAERGSLSVETVKKHGKEKQEYVMKDIFTERQLHPKLNVNWDPFCWRCHKSVPAAEQHGCPACVRVFHEYCWWNEIPYRNTNPLDIHQGFVSVEQSAEDAESGSTDTPYQKPKECIECHRILEEEKNPDNVVSRVGADKFKSYLLYMMRFVQEHLPAERVRPFAIPVVDQDECSDYVKAKYMEYITCPMDLRQITQNISEGKYVTCASFLADLGWIYHNTSIFNGQNNRYTRSACYIVETCQHLCLSLEWCQECFERGMPLPGETVHEGVERGMTTPCSVPHALVWVKADKYPLWPAIVYRFNGTIVDVRFFGAFEFGMFPKEAVYLFCRSVGTDRRKGRLKLDYENALRQFKLHVSKLRLLIDKELNSYPKRYPYDGRLKMFPDDEVFPPPALPDNLTDQSSGSSSKRTKKLKIDIPKKVLEVQESVLIPSVSVITETETTEETSEASGSQVNVKRSRSGSVSMDGSQKKRKVADNSETITGSPDESVVDSQYEIVAVIGESSTGISSRIRRKKPLTRKVQTVISPVEQASAPDVPEVIVPEEPLEEKLLIEVVQETIPVSDEAPQQESTDAQMIEEVIREPEVIEPKSEVVEPTPLVIEEPDDMVEEPVSKALSEGEPEIERLMVLEEEEVPEDAAGSVRPIRFDDESENEIGEMPSFEMPDFEYQDTRSSKAAGKLDLVLKRNDQKRSTDSPGGFDSSGLTDASRVISGVGLAARMSMGALTQELNKALPANSQNSKSVLHDALVRPISGNHDPTRRVPRKQGVPSMVTGQSHLIQALRATQRPSGHQQNEESSASNNQEGPDDNSQSRPRSFRDETLGSLLASTPRISDQFRRSGILNNTSNRGAPERSSSPGSPFVPRTILPKADQPASSSSNLQRHGHTFVYGNGNRSIQARPTRPVENTSGSGGGLNSTFSDQNLQRSILARSLNAGSINQVHKQIPVNGQANGNQGSIRSGDTNGERLSPSALQSVMRNLVAARSATHSPSAQDALRVTSAGTGAPRSSSSQAESAQSQIEMFLRSTKKLVREKKSESVQALRDIGQANNEAYRLLQDVHNRSQTIAEKTIQDLQEALEQGVRKFELLFTVFQSETEFTQKTKTLEISRVKDLERQRAVSSAKHTLWCCVCQRRAKLLCCGVTMYCSESCQSNHAAIHRMNCSRLNPAAEHDDKVYSQFGVLSRCPNLPSSVQMDDNADVEPVNASHTFPVENGWNDHPSDSISQQDRRNS